MARPRRGESPPGLSSRLPGRRRADMESFWTWLVQFIRGWQGRRRSMGASGEYPGTGWIRFDAYCLTEEERSKILKEQEAKAKEKKAD